MVGIAVKLTGLPGQIKPGGVEINTAGVTCGLTTAVKFAIAVGGTGQATLDVRTTEMRSPLLSVVVLNDARLLPTFTPFTFH